MLYRILFIFVYLCGCYYSFAHTHTHWVFVEFNHVCYRIDKMYYFLSRSCLLHFWSNPFLNFCMKLACLSLLFVEVLKMTILLNIRSWKIPSKYLNNAVWYYSKGLTGNILRNSFSECFMGENYWNALIYHFEGSY